jgi:antiviral defense system Shedu protein SduA
MNCSGAQSLFALYLDDNLTGSRGREVSDHISRCAKCSSDYQALRATQALLTSLGNRRPVPPDLALRIRATTTGDKDKQSSTPQSFAGQSEHLHVTTDDYVAFAVLGNKLKAVTLKRDGAYQYLDEGRNLHNIVYLANAETVAFERAIEELESLINDSATKENDFHCFLEKNRGLILNDSYKQAHSQIFLAPEDQGSLIPDFLLEPIDQSSLCDILELKLPSAPVFVLKEHRMRFSSAVAEAKAQLLEYSRYFDDKTNRAAIYEKYGLRAYKPKMFLIIGRMGKIDAFDRRFIEASDPSLCLNTYDDVINRARQRLKRMIYGGLNTLK